MHKWLMPVPRRRGRINQWGTRAYGTDNWQVSSKKKKDKSVVTSNMVQILWKTGVPKALLRRLDGMIATMAVSQTVCATTLLRFTEGYLLLFTSHDVTCSSPIHPPPDLPFSSIDHLGSIGHRLSGTRERKVLGWQALFH